MNGLIVVIVVAFVVLAFQRAVVWAIFVFSVGSVGSLDDRFVSQIVELLLDPPVRILHKCKVLLLSTSQQRVSQTEYLPDLEASKFSLHAALASRFNRARQFSLKRMQKVLLVIRD